jgi:voltage-gated potassium channel
VAPPDDTVLAAGDDLLLAGTSADRRALDTTLCVPAAMEYVVSGRRVGNSWVWRALVNRE